MYEHLPIQTPEHDLEYIPPCELPTRWGSFALHAFVERGSGKEHLALTLGDLAGEEPVLGRVHSECLTGDALFSLRCDCGDQLETALQRIAAAGRGVLLYLRQEGRGIGLANKIRAYRVQEAGADTVDANHMLGLESDLRDYALVKPMLERLGVQSLKLMTNNPAKPEALRRHGVVVAQRLPIISAPNPFNRRYLHTKTSRMGHLMPLAEGEQTSQGS